MLLKFFNGRYGGLELSLKDAPMPREIVFRFDGELDDYDEKDPLMMTLDFRLLTARYGIHSVTNEAAEYRELSPDAPTPEIDWSSCSTE